MVLFSGVIGQSFGENCKRFPDCADRHFCKLLHPYNYYNNPNFLYTGDFEPEKNIDQMLNYYHKYWNEVSTVQVPHHGSKNNYDVKLYEKPIRVIVSVGNANPYHHPDIDTLIKIRDQGCHPVIVTEDKSSMRIYHYSF